jgi:hypothetical protein
MKKLKQFKAWLKNLNNPMKWVGKEMKYQTNSIFNFFHWWRMKRRALRAWKMTGLQHHIIPAGPDNIIIINNRWRKNYNKIAKHNKIDITQILNMAYFSTPQGNRIIKK